MNDEINIEFDSDVVDDEELTGADDGAAILEDDANDEFEYDDEGNILIPRDGEKDTDAEDEEIVVEDEERDETDSHDGTDKKKDGGDSDGGEEEVIEPVGAKEDERDAKIQNLTRQLNELEAQVRDTLEGLGVDTTDLNRALVKLAAEAAEMSEEEYLRKRTEKRQNEEARVLLERERLQRTMMADLAAIHAAYPATKKFKSVEEFPNFEEFGRRRDGGLPPKEAFAVTHMDLIVQDAVNSAKQQSLNGTKRHLQSAVPKGSRDTSLTMTKAQLKQYRELFPNMSDKERIALYRQTMRK